MSSSNNNLIKLESIQNAVKESPTADSNYLESKFARLLPQLGFLPEKSAVEVGLLANKIDQLILRTQSTCGKSPFDASASMSPAVISGWLCPVVVST
jgi:hypothetical protein